MDLIIKQSCPSCSAPIELHESDRLIRCPFCDVQNFMITRGPLRFVLPDRVPTHISLKEIFYFPYLRFKGKVFFCLSNLLDYKIIDTTYIGLKNYDLPPSLGLRPRAMTLRPVTHKIEGRFVKKNETAMTIFDKAAKLSELGQKKGREVLVHRSFIGETLSIIYLPTYYHDGQLYDGVLNIPIGSSGGLTATTANSMLFQDKWMPKFITTICPGCGDTLHGERDSVVLFCKNCHSSYQESNGRFVKIDWSLIVANTSRTRYLPFWKLQIEVTGVTLKSFADMLRLTNQPVVINETHEKVLPAFIVPAFKIRPKTFLRVAAAITLSQLQILEGETAMATHMHPVTLAASEAEQAIKAVLAAMTINKQELLPHFPKISCRLQKVELLYLPFVDHGHDLISEQMGVSIISNVLRFGRAL